MTYTNPDLNPLDILCVGPPILYASVISDERLQHKPNYIVVKPTDKNPEDWGRTEVQAKELVLIRKHLFYFILFWNWNFAPPPSFFINIYETPVKTEEQITNNLYKSIFIAILTHDFETWT